MSGSDKKQKQAQLTLYQALSKPKQVYFTFLSGSAKSLTTLFYLSTQEVKLNKNHLVTHALSLPNTKVQQNMYYNPVSTLFSKTALFSKLLHTDSCTTTQSLCDFKASTI